MLKQWKCEFVTNLLTGEMLLLKILIPYLVVLNFIGFWSMRTDKRRAMTHRYRTPEKRLFLYAVLGGSAGCLLGMKVYRHKTKHRAFTLGMPIILLLQVFIMVLGSLLWLKNSA